MSQPVDSFAPCAASCARTSASTSRAESAPCDSHGDSFDEYASPSRPLRVSLYVRIGAAAAPAEPAPPAPHT